MCAEGGKVFVTVHNLGARENGKSKFQQCALLMIRLWEVREGLLDSSEQSLARSWEGIWAE